MAIAYTATQGISLGRQRRPLAAWYGDLDFMPHIRRLIADTALDAVVSFDAPMPADSGFSRKDMTQRLEQATRRMMAQTLRGRPLAAEFVPERTDERHPKLASPLP
jgi:1-acyl-sn-glycerol-3-phosphate acyltransferase